MRDFLPGIAGIAAYALAAYVLLSLTLSGCGTKPQPECLTDTECQQWAIERGWPDDRIM